MDGYTSRLMPLRSGDYLVTEEGEMVEANEEVLVDERGLPYLLDLCYGCATPLFGYTAYNKESMPVRFVEELADMYEVIV